MRHAVAFLLIVAVACTSTADPSTTTREMGPASTTSQVPVTTDPEPTHVTTEVPFLPVPPAPEGWEVVFFAGYGPAEDQVGNGLDIHEKYGPYEPVVMDRHGFWHVADVYKHRVARFDPAGAFVDSVSTPENTPMAGLVPLDNGDLFAAASGNKVALISTNGVSLHSAGGAGNPILIDSFGDSAFGFGTGGTIYRYTLEGDSLAAERGVDYYQGADGGSYRFEAIDVVTHRLRLPDEAAVMDLVPIPDDGSDAEIAIGEPIRDAKGRTHLIIYGTSIGSPEVQRGVYVRIDGAELAVSAPMPNIFSGWGWSLQTNLGIDNDDKALVTTVDPDGVRVWRFRD